jgi:multiple sugar transport system permease protein
MAIRSLDLARVYDVIRIMTDGGPGNRTETIWTYVYRLSFTGHNYALGSAMSYVTVAISFLFTWYLFRNVIKSRWEGRE